MGDLLRLQLVLESADDVTPLDLFNLLRSVEVNEIIDTHKATTNAHLNLVALFDLDVYALLTERVDALRLSQEEDLDSVAFGIRVDVVGKMSVDLVHLVADADMLGAFHDLLQVDHELVDFILSFLVLHVPLIIMLLNSHLGFIQLLARLLQFLARLLQLLVSLLQVLARLLQFLVRFIQLLDGFMQFFLHGIEFFFLILQIMIHILNILLQVAPLLLSLVRLIIFFSQRAVK